MSECPIHGEQCRFYIPFDGPSTAKLAVIGEGPGEQEMTAKRPFAGPSGGKLNDYLKAQGIERKDVFVYNAVPCFAGPPRDPTELDIKTWRPHLLEVLATNRPAVIVAAGAWALYILTGKKGIKKEQGIERQVHLADGYDPWIVPVFHPAYCMRVGDFTALTEGLAKAALLLKDESLPDWMPGYNLVTDEFLLHEAVDELSQEPVLSFDIESAGKPFDGGEIVLLGLGGIGKKPWVFPLHHPEAPTDFLEAAKDGIRRIFREGRNVRIAHNGKYDTHWLKAASLVEADQTIMSFDTMLAAHLLDESRADRGRLKLKVMGQELFAISAYWLKEVEVTNTLKSGKTKQVRLSIAALLKSGRAKEIPLQDLSEYNARDVYLTLRLYERVSGELKAAPQLQYLFDNLVMPTARVMEDMERVGLPVDMVKMDKLEKEYTANRKAIYTGLHNYTPGKEINWDSPKQVGQVLYTDLGLPVVRITEPTPKFPTGQPSTDDDALWLLRGQHPIIATLQTLRKAKKACETVESLRGFVAPDGRIHPTFVLAGPVTGRTASRDPNVQNLPRGAGIRDIIRAADGKTLVEVDLSLIEMRWGAHIYKEPTMAKLLIEGRDLHRYTASLAFGRSADEVSDSERQLGKTTNFLLLYGGGPNKLAGELRSSGLSNNEAVQALMTMGKLASVDDPLRFVALELHKAFHRAYPGLGEAHARIRRQIIRDKYVRSVFGRVRKLDAINSTDPEVREEAARKGSNTLVQGPASDTNLLGLMGLSRVIDKYGAHIIDAVHDSVLAEVPNEHVEMFAKEVKHIVEHPPLEAFNIEFPIPIEAEVKVGQSWGSMKKLKSEEVPMSHVQSPPEVPSTPQASGTVPGVLGDVPETVAEISSQVLPSAMTYHSRGWSVIPLTSPKTGNGADDQVGKRPSLPSWDQYQTKQAPLDMVLRWFTPSKGLQSNYNVAVITGKVSGLVVIDVDVKRNGEVWLKETGLDSTAKVRTGGGGLHLYFKHDGNPPLKNKINLAPGVDVRAEGGYVAAPPSLHMSGRRYHWLSEDGSVPLSIPPMPEWLLEKLTAAAAAPEIPPEPVSGDGRSIPDDKVDTIVEFLQPYYTEGVRHQFALALAGFLLKRNYRLEDVGRTIQALMFAAGDLEPFDREKVLFDTNRRVRTGEIVNGSKALGELIGRDAVEQLQNLFGTVHAGGTVQSLTALDVKHMELAQQDWLIEGVLPKNGIAMLSGHPGAGKTTFIIQLGLQLAAGQVVLGDRAVPQPFKVLYFQADNPPNMVRRLIKSMMQSGRITDEAAERFIISEVLTSVKITTSEGYEIIDQHINLYSPDLLIFDTLRDFHGADENNPTAVSETIDTLKRLRGTRNMAILYIHHHSKTSGFERQAIERHMGSMRFVTPVDLAMALTFVPEDTSKIKLAFTKVRWTQRPASRLFIRDRDWYQDLGPVSEL